MDEKNRKALRRIRRVGEIEAVVLDLSGLGLTELPSALWELLNLQVLKLRGNQLSTLPADIGMLMGLRILDIRANSLESLPPEIGELENLEELYLEENHLRLLPPQIGYLQQLEELYLGENLLESLPEEIGYLTQLQWLFLEGNRLVELPSTIGNLSSLEVLDLSYNSLSVLPSELGKLDLLRELHLSDNPLIFPPPEIAEQGTTAVFEFLRAQSVSGERQWISKLIVVGEGRVGKTSLLRRLRGEGFSQDVDTTHGIEIVELELDHPAENARMTLHAWDFGGQDIYHATHQFFLTNRSLFLLAWNAGGGNKEGRVEFWLDTIKALAPDSPVLLVATHIDQRAPIIAINELKHRYPQLVDHYSVSSKTGSGIGELREAIRRLAAELPLMGEIWPSTWLQASESIREFPERHISTDRLWEIMEGYGIVWRSTREVLARWLHELGDILYFPDDNELRDTVVLKPAWVSQHISQVLEDEDVIDNNGVFTRAAMERIWAAVGDRTLRERFLRLMERFDLSYRIPDDPDRRSLVVERLSPDEADYRAAWDEIGQHPNSHELYMRYELDLTMPAGIPTWFIARSHRFTTNTHWRTGALFADDESQTHLALVQANRNDRKIRLTVRGPYPGNFLALLRDGLELTLNRFEGMKYSRYLPCSGHDGELCDGEFRYEVLENALKAGVSEVQCQTAFKLVRVASILSGIDYQATESTVLARLDQLEADNSERHGEAMDELRELRAYAQREFAKQHVRAQRLEESHTPSVITLTPYELHTWIPDFIRQKMVLQLWCEAPGHWHPTNVKVAEFSPPQDSGRYIIDVNAEWLSEILPHLRHLSTLLKFVTPFWGGDTANEWTRAIELTGQLAGNVWDEFSIAGSGPGQVGEKAHYTRPERFEGAALRALRELLDRHRHKSPYWGGLRKVLTPEGHYLWLCEHHAKEYIPPPIRLSDDA